MVNSSLHRFGFSHQQMLHEVHPKGAINYVPTTSITRVNMISKCSYMNPYIITGVQKFNSVRACDIFFHLPAKKPRRCFSTHATIFLCLPLGSTISLGILGRTFLVAPSCLYPCNYFHVAALGQERLQGFCPKILMGSVSCASSAAAEYGEERNSNCGRSRL